MSRDSKSISVSGARLRLAAYLIVAATLLQVVYVIQLQITNAYMGFQPYEGSFGQILTTIAMTITVIYVVPRKISRPSDLFALFYGMIVLMSCSVFNQVTGMIDGTQSLALFLTMLVPVIAVLLLRKVPLKVPPVLSLPPVVVYGTAVALVGVAFAYGYSKGGGGSFDWAAMYERRMEGRGQFEARSVGAYVLSMAINGLAPFVAFAGATRRSVTLLALGVSMGCFAFWLLGLKAPVVMALLFAITGNFVRTGHLDRVPRLIAAAIVVSSALAIVEKLIFGQSLIAEFVVRRAFTVQGQLQSYHWDVVLRAISANSQSFLFGTDFAAHGGVTYFVGSEYLGKPAANASTNAFLVALSGGGLVAYVASVLFVSVYLSVMDALYRSSGRPEVIFVVALYCLLLTEQAFTVAFVSSGVGLLTVLVFVMARKARCPMPESRSASCAQTPLSMAGK